MCVPVNENVNSWGTAGCMVEWSPPSCRLPLHHVYFWSWCGRVCVCESVYAHGLDQWELVRNVTVAQQQSLLHMD